MGSGSLPSFEQMLAESRAHIAATFARARRDDATRQEIIAGLELSSTICWTRRAIELCALPLSRTERRAALAAFGDELEKRKRADLVLLE